MNATNWFRATAVILLLFALAHTAGFVRFVPDTAEGAAVRDAMSSVQFSIGGRQFTYRDFYNGFGFSVTVYLTFCAVLAWQLGALARTNPQLVTGIAWVFAATQAATLVVSVIYFFTPPIISSLLVAVTATVAAWLTQRAAG